MILLSLNATLHRCLASCRSVSLRCSNTSMDQAWEKHWITSSVRFHLVYWHADFWSCPGRNTSTPFDRHGLPALPSQLPATFHDHNDLNRAMHEAAGLNYQECRARLDFPATAGADPLMHDVRHEPGDHRVKPVDWTPLAHLRWLSSTWWCRQQGLLAIVPAFVRDPRALCKERQVDMLFGSADAGMAISRQYHPPPVATTTTTPFNPHPP